MKVYTRVNGKLALYDVDSDHIELARETVKTELNTSEPVLVLIERETQNANTGTV